jgi:hypothetical protein
VFTDTVPASSWRATRCVRARGRWSTELFARDERSDLRVGIHRVAQFEVFDPCDYPIE